MVTLPTQTTGDRPSNPEAHDLTQIRGIGVVKQRWLKSIGIDTLQDLARTEVNALETRLQDAGYSVYRREITEWMAQAQAWANSVVLLEANANSSFEAHDEPQTNVLESAVQSHAVADGEWAAVAVFRVEVQQRSQAGDVEQRTIAQRSDRDIIQIWTGIPDVELQQWLSDQVDQAVMPESPAMVLDPNAPMTRTSAKVEILQVTMVPALHTAATMTVTKTNRLFPEALQTGEPFALEIVLGITGQWVAEEPPSFLVYHTQCYARHLSTGMITLLGDAEIKTRAGERSPQAVRLANTILEHPGLYRFQVFATLQNAQAAPGFFEVPVVQSV